jgi:hypothetical protein
MTRRTMRFWKHLLVKNLALDRVRTYLLATGSSGTPVALAETRQSAGRWFAGLAQLVEQLICNQ